MTRDELLEFMRSHRYAVESSVSPAAAPEAAVVGIAVTDRFEIVFDTLASSRKAENLRRHPRIAFVIGDLGLRKRLVHRVGGASRGTSRRTAEL